MKSISCVPPDAASNGSREERDAGRADRFLYVRRRWYSGIQKNQFCSSEAQRPHLCEEERAHWKEGRAQCEGVEMIGGPAAD